MQKQNLFRSFRQYVQSLNHLLDALTLPATPELHQDLVYCPSFLTLLLKKCNLLLTLLHIIAYTIEDNNNIKWGSVQLFA